MIPPEYNSSSVRLFYSYSHKDEMYRDELEEHLSLLKRQGLIHSWHDRRIGAGQEWQDAIDENLEAANVILILVSAAFLASDYCYDREMKRALEKHDRGEVRLIPIIIRPVDWSGAPFSKLQALPKDAKPVTSWSNRDEAWADVALGVRKAIGELMALSIQEQKREEQAQAKAKHESKTEAKHLDWNKAPEEETGHEIPEKALLELVSPYVVRALKGHTKPVTTVAFSPDGSMLASGSGGELFSGDCSVRLWNVADGKLLRTLEGHRDRVDSIAFSPDGTTLVSASTSGKVWLWRVSDGARFPIFEQVLGTTVALSPNGAVMASVNEICLSSKDAAVELWRFSDGGHLSTLKSPDAEYSFQSIAFSPDGAILAGVSMRTIFLWHVTQGKILRSFRVSEEEQGPKSIAFSPNGKTLAAGASSIWLWRASDGKLLHRLKEQGKNYDALSQGVNSVAFSPDGSVVGSGHDDKTVRLWRVSDGRIAYRSKEHQKQVNEVAFSPDGAMLASGSDDQTVRLWVVAQPE